MSILDRLKLTRLTRHHVAQMARLHEAAFERGWSEADFVENLNNEHDDILGLVEIGEAGAETAIGFILIRTLDDQSEILTIVVDQMRTGQGVGALLLKAGERTARRRGADIMFLEVAQDNPSAIALYTGAGYQRCGTRTGYYKRGANGANGRVDALLFQRKLTS